MAIYSARFISGARLVPAVLTLALAGCGQTGGSAAATSTATSTTVAPSASASATAIPAAAPAAVMVKDFLVEGGPTYTVSIVGLDGHVLASATAAKRPKAGTTRVQMSSMSTSASRLYYLDGSSAVHFLGPDGSTGLATTIQLGANQAAVFAVSPDDRRIAVSVLDFTRYPAGTRLYVEDLNGGGNHIELFSSSTVEEWPVGWHNGNLVMAVGVNAQPQNSGEFFNYGHGYHVVDAATGNRVSDVCSGFDSYYPPVSGGTLCVNDPVSKIAAWDGSATSVPEVAGCLVNGALSPDGSRIAMRIARNGCGVPTVSLVAATGSVTQTSATGSPQGWVDADHLVVMTALLSATGPSVIYSISTGTRVSIESGGFFGGALPGGL